MILPDQIVKSNRKTLSLTIKKDGTILVNAPNRMNEEQINKFIAQKQGWLAGKLAIIQNNQNKYSEIISGKSMLLFAKQYKIAVAEVKKVEIIKDCIVCSKKIDNNKIMPAIINFYKKKAKEILIKRVGYLQGILRICPSTIKISNTKGRWGSCSSSGVVTLNWRIIMLAPSIIDYIIIHELCHLVEMNHSKRFWTLVETFLPNYNQQRHDLKEFGFLLELYR